MIGKTTTTRNAIAGDFATALAADFAEHGVSAIEKLREKDVAAYLRLVAAIEPKSADDDAASRTLEALSDEEIERFFADIKAARRRTKWLARRTRSISRTRTSGTGPTPTGSTTTSPASPIVAFATSWQP